jgi:CheY-like chemotaxis protein
MTAHALKGDEERCLEIGMDAYVSKPIRSQELFATIERILTRPGSPKKKTAEELPARQMN